jgi:hypothetical protein
MDVHMERDLLQGTTMERGRGAQGISTQVQLALRHPVAACNQVFQDLIDSRSLRAMTEPPNGRNHVVVDHFD